MGTVRLSRLPDEPGNTASDGSALSRLSSSWPARPSTLRTPPARSRPFRYDAPTTQPQSPASSPPRRSRGNCCHTPAPPTGSRRPSTTPANVPDRRSPACRQRRRRTPCAPRRMPTRQPRRRSQRPHKIRQHRRPTTPHRSEHHAITGACTVPLHSRTSEQLIVSVGTVKTPVTRDTGQLKLRDRVHSVMFAYESGLITRDDNNQ
jgi:hypothetical protein